MSRDRQGMLLSDQIQETDPAVAAAAAAVVVVVAAAAAVVVAAVAPGAGEVAERRVGRGPSAIGQSVVIWVA